MHIKYINNRNHEAKKLIDAVTNELAEKYQIDPLQIHEKGNGKIDNEHHKLYYLEAIADFLNRLNQTTVQDNQEGVEEVDEK